jgi:flagellar basal-body rod protein FlgG
MRALSIAATGMLAQQLNVEVISNNIANMNTTAYQRRRAEFADLLYQNLRRVGADSSSSGSVVPTGVQVGLGVRATATVRMTEQGNLISTENPLDTAVEGEGYFLVTLPTGDTAYTRAGSFQLSPQGELVTTDGFTVSPGITIPTDAIEVTINAQGQILVKVDGQVAPNNVGQLQLAIFANDAGLEAIGDNMFLETPASGAATTGTPGAIGFGSLRQGFLETSNVNVVTEITNLIAAQRAYEMNSRVIETADQMMSTLNQIR